MTMFTQFAEIVLRPRPFEHDTTHRLWTDPHLSKGMLEAHLDQSHEAASHRTDFISTGVAWMASRFGISEGTKVCDFGCGPGLWTTQFAEAGATVTGVDFSERSLRHARELAANRNLQIEYVLQDYRQFCPQDEYDFITMIHGDFSVFSPGQTETMLGIFRSALSSNGKLVFEINSPEHFRAASEKTTYAYYPAGGYWSPGPHHLFISTFKYEQEMVVCDKYTVFDEDRELEIFVWLQCYDVESLGAITRKHGLRIEEWFSDVTGAPASLKSKMITIVASKT